MNREQATAAQLDRVIARAALSSGDRHAVCVALQSPTFGYWRSERESGEGAAAGPRGAARPFRIASITKPFVAATLRCLARRGAIDLRAPVSTLLAAEAVESLGRGGYVADAITPEHLLSHTSGLVDHSTLAAYEQAVLAEPRRRWSRAEQIALAVEHGRPHAPPGEYYSYSDTGYVLLGEIIERASGLSLATAVRHELKFDVLGLSHTWWEEMEAAPPDAGALARQYQGALDVTHFHASFDLYGGGGLVSTVDDLTRFVRALFDGTLFDRRELLAALRTPAARRDPALEPWRTHGYLVATYRVGDRWVLGHTGHWGSAMLYCPDSDVALAATVNHSGDVARSFLFETIERLLAVVGSR